jgi:GR25 family glycosyltransferase involved in LPS biosynthesis
MNTQGFIIHLARAVQRQERVKALMSCAPCPTTVFDAVDGRSMTDADLARVLSSTPLLRPTYPFRIGRGEVACFLSHRSIWQHMVDSGIDQALILEDDVSLGSDFPAAFALACRFAGLEGFVQFQTRPIRGRAEVVAQDGAVHIIRPSVVPRRTSAQLIGRMAAKRLLEKCEKIDRPVDGFLQLVWETGQNVHCVVPSGVTDMTDTVGGTTIQGTGQPRILEKLRRAYHRAAYRTAVRRLSRG